MNILDFDYIYKQLTTAEGPLSLAQYFTDKLNANTNLTNWLDTMDEILLFWHIFVLIDLTLAENYAIAIRLIKVKEVSESVNNATH